MAHEERTYDVLLTVRIKVDADKADALSDDPGWISDTEGYELPASGIDVWADLLATRVYRELLTSDLILWGQEIGAGLISCDAKVDHEE